MSNSLDPDQARRFVGPDLGPNCLPRLSADVTGRQRVETSSRNTIKHDLVTTLEIADKQLTTVNRHYIDQP